MPPLALAWSIANCTPRISAVPISAPGPVRGRMPPKVMVSAPAGGPASIRPAATAIAPMEEPRIVNYSCFPRIVATVGPAIRQGQAVGFGRREGARKLEPQNTQTTQMDEP